MSRRAACRQTDLPCLRSPRCGRFPARGSTWNSIWTGPCYRTLPARVVLEFQLVVGMVLSAADLKTLDDAADRGACMDAALRYLSYRSRSRSELHRHLQKKYPPQVVDVAVDRCADLGYVDDLAFAQAFARDRIRLKPRGVVRIVSELRAKGVSMEDARAGVGAAFEASERSENDLLADVAGRRWKALTGRDPAVARRRLTAYLLRRGFPPIEVRAAVGRLVDGDNGVS